MSLELSIIIPYHNETAARLAIGLASINSQIGVDFQNFDVTLIGDGGIPVSASDFDWCSNLQLNVINYQDSVGAGCARQRGIDHTSGKYIMFMDADDQLQDVTSLSQFFSTVGQTGDHQVLIAGYDEIVGNSGLDDSWVMPHPYNWSAAYAKWFCRSYLDQLGLKWHSKLRIFEDSYFVGLACKLANDILPIKKTVYTWNCNPNSTVRHDDQVLMHQLDQWVASNRYSLNFLAVKAPQWIPSDFPGLLADLYFREQLYPPENEKAYHQQLIKLFQEHHDLWPEKRSSVAEAAQGLVKPGQSFAGQKISESGMNDFLNRMDKIANEANTVTSES